MKDLVAELKQSNKKSGLPRKTCCPCCGSVSSSVMSTFRRNRAHNSPGIRRKRRCEDCGDFYITVEILEEDYKSYLHAFRNVGFIVSSLEKFIKFVNKLQSKI